MYQLTFEKQAQKFIKFLVITAIALPIGDFLTDYLIGEGSHLFYFWNFGALCTAASMVAIDTLLITLNRKYGLSINKMLVFTAVLTAIIYSGLTLIETGVI